ncbi:hypothetical protein HNY73_011614 [Argiope bruennichi]|uniref:Uncharacterized protein n=1 Tax=Argiope bruennichi TaxID=94029 RepID=A0A8T0F1F7_ARGBR|nr:hypothetical protein HNY73_011614 [Argiope bruennichi]
MSSWLPLYTMTQNNRTSTRMSSWLFVHDDQNRNRTSTKNVVLASLYTMDSKPKQNSTRMSSWLPLYTMTQNRNRTSTKVRPGSLCNDDKPNRQCTGIVVLVLYTRQNRTEDRQDSFDSFQNEQTRKDRPATLYTGLK